MARTKRTDLNEKVLEYLARGYNQEEIGQLIGYSRCNVNHICKGIMIGLGASNTANAVAIAIAKGIIVNPYVKEDPAASWAWHNPTRHDQPKGHRL